MCVCASVSPVSLSTLHRWADGADHRGNHGGAAQGDARDEGLHRYLRTSRPIREPGAGVCAVGGGQMHCE